MSSLEYYPPFFPKYSHNQYIKFENLQIVSPSEDVKIINVLGHYLRKYGSKRKCADTCNCANRCKVCALDHSEVGYVDEVPTLVTCLLTPSRVRPESIQNPKCLKNCLEIKDLTTSQKTF